MLKLCTTLQWQALALKVYARSVTGIITNQSAAIIGKQRTWLKSNHRGPTLCFVTEFKTLISHGTYMWYSNLISERASYVSQFIYKPTRDKYKEALRIQNSSSSPLRFSHLHFTLF